MAAHYDKRNLCISCDAPVALPTEPPFNRMPVYCSDTCRSSKNTYVNTQDITWAEFMEVQSQPIDRLPTNRGVPYTRLHKSVRDRFPLASLSPRVQISIAWWKHSLNQVVDWLSGAQFAFYGVYAGTKPFQQPGHPWALEPLAHCWPYLPKDLQSQLDRNGYRTWLMIWKARGPKYSQAAEIRLRLTGIHHAILMGDVPKAVAERWLTVNPKTGMTKAQELCRRHQNYMATPPLSKWVRPDVLEEMEEVAATADASLGALAKAHYKPYAKWMPCPPATVDVVREWFNSDEWLLLNWIETTGA